MRPMNPNTSAIISGAEGTAVNRTLRNTYFLLSLTLIFSALCAMWSMQVNAKPGLIVLIIGMFGLYFLTMALRNSKWGLVAIFAYTGFMGFVLGPILNLYLHNYVNGMQLITTALGATAFIFLGLTAFTLLTKKDFSYMGGFLSIAIMGVFLMSIIGIFFQMPIFQLVISGAFAALMAAFILYQTSEIVHGGQRNVIVATISLYIAIFNIFVFLLQILGAFAGNGRD